MVGKRYLWSATLCIFLLALTSCSNVYQTAGIRDAMVPLQTRALTVRYAGSPQEAMQAAVNTFKQRGYTIQHTDNDLRIVSTNYAEDESGAMVSLTAKVLEQESPTLVELRGLMQTGVGSMAPIQKAGRQGSKFRGAWAELFLTATSLGSIVQYQ